MEAALEHLDQSYGGAEAYLRAGGGLRQEELDVEQVSGAWSGGGHRMSIRLGRILRRATCRWEGALHERIVGQEEAVEAVAEHCASQGVDLVYHHHMGTIVESGENIDSFMQATGPSVHLLLDTGHATWGGADPAALARRYRNRISHVHTHVI